MLYEFRTDGAGADNSVPGNKHNVQLPKDLLLLCCLCFVSVYVVLCVLMYWFFPVSVIFPQRKVFLYTGRFFPMRVHVAPSKFHVLSVL